MAGSVRRDVGGEAAAGLAGEHSASCFLPSFAVPAIVVVALLARILALLLVVHPELRSGTFLFKNDEGQYHAIATNVALSGSYSMAPGDPPTASRPPGMTLPLALLYFVAEPSPLLAIAYLMCCSVLSVLAVGELSRRTIAVPSVAVTSMLIMSLLPTGILTGSGIWSEPPAILLMLVTLLLLLRAEHSGGTADWAVVGLGGAASFLTRSSALFWFPLLVWRCYATVDVGTRLRALAVLALCLGLPIFAWGLRNEVAVGELALSGTLAGRGFWETHNPVTAGLAMPESQGIDEDDLYEDASRGRFLGGWLLAEYIPGSEYALEEGLSEVEANRRFSDLVSRFMREHPGAFVQLFGLKIRRLLTAEPMAPSMSGDSERERQAKRLLTFLERWFILIFGTMGMVQLYREHHALRHHFAAMAAAGLAVMLMSLVNARFFFPVATVLVVPAALGVDGVWKRRRSGKPGKNISIDTA